MFPFFHFPGPFLSVLRCYLSIAIGPLSVVCFPASAQVPLLACSWTHY